MRKGGGEREERVKELRGKGGGREERKRLEGRGEGGTLNDYFWFCFSSQILLSFTLFYLLLAVVSNWVRHTVIVSTLKRVKAVFTRCVLGMGKERGREGGGREGEEGKGREGGKGREMGR